MAKKLMSFKTKGMNRDLSVSAFSPEFSFENHNLRLSTNEGNTLMSWVNERGTKPLVFVTGDWKDIGDNLAQVTEISGIPIGTAIINNQLVLFTHTPDDAPYGETEVVQNPDHIYVIKYSDKAAGEIKGIELFSGDLNFDIEHPLETIIYYESDNIQKVYWADGKNQLRLINICKEPGYYAYAKDFDFSREINLEEDIRVEKNYISSGEFPAGVIQYAFTYYNKNAQESNVFRVTPLQYIAPSSRGAAADEKVNVVFKVYAKDLDTSFDYLRIYSIIRTSINSAPIVRRVQDIKLSTDEVQEPDTWKLIFVDTNLTGELVDPSSLLYLANKLYVVPQTIEQKDGTLFLGNLTYSKDVSVISQEIKDEILEDNELNHALATANVTSVLDERPFYKEILDGYVWINTFRCPDNIKDTNDNPAYYEGASCFKSGEYYRLGIQFQNTMGRWSEPVWIGDKQWTSDTTHSTTKWGPESDYYGSDTPILPYTGSDRIAVEALPEFRYTISASIQNKLYSAGYRRMRAVYAQPDPTNRTILCQNVACPTMWRKTDREEFETVYAQSSWLFRAPLNLNKYHGFLDTTSYGSGAGGAVADKTYNYTTIESGQSVIHELGLPSIYSQRVHRGMKINRLNMYSEWYYDDKCTTGMPPDTDNNKPRIPEWSSGPDVLDTNYVDMGLFGTLVWMPYYRSTEIMGTYDENTCFNIDTKTITLHSPDSVFDEFSSYIVNADLSLVDLVPVGTTTLDSTTGDIDFTLESGSKPTNPYVDSATAIQKRKIRTIGTSALISGNFYKDSILTSEDEDEYEPLYVNGNLVYWPLFMWHKKGSLNNDCRSTGDARLHKKIISNYRFCGGSSYRQPGTALNTDATEIFTESEDTGIFTIGEKKYKGCVDMLLSSDLRSDYYFVGMPTFDDGDYHPGDLPDSGFPEVTDLPVCKLHCVFFYDYPEAQSSVSKDDFDENDFYFAIEFNTYDGLDGWATSKNMPDSNQVSPSGPLRPKSDGGLGYRWNSYGEHYEDIGSENKNLTFFKGIVPIKYKSTPHIVSILNSSEDDIYDKIGQNNEEKLLLVEARKEYSELTLYGGYTSREAFGELSWIPCGPITQINPEDSTVVEYKWGDSYYQRYECLKTYAYTPEDLNQVVEIGSFMLETRVNLDGRYDKNRGTTNMLYASPQNFNLINPIYSQMDNFFSYKIVPDAEEQTDNYSNLVTWTLTKESGADVDAWTNITLASTLELDGTCGQLNKLIKLNDQLLAFQDTGVSQILYNENAQITTTEGVPVELGNSGKVTGKKYFSNTVGCSNKWSIAKSGTGIYFMDSHEKSIYLFNGQLTNLSDKFGFNTWCKNNIPSLQMKWNPLDFNAFVSYYDRINQEVLFINKNTTLAFSEKIGAFTSFYDYQSIPYFCNLEDTGLWVTSSGELWQHQTGEYCRFFDTNYPYSMTLIGNPEPQSDKIFTNLEFRACVEGEGDTVNGKYIPTIPFDYIETWNEYQHGIANLSVKSGIGAGMHHLADKTASLNRKFRMWRCDIPRDNAELGTDAALGISRYAKHPLDRMRNPWIYIKLVKNEAAQDYLSDEIGIGVEPGLVTASLPKAEIHDLVMTYYN